MTCLRDERMLDLIAAMSQTEMAEHLLYDFAQRARAEETKAYKRGMAAMELSSQINDVRVERSWDEFQRSREN